MISIFITAQILLVCTYVVYRLFFAKSKLYHLRRRFLVVACCLSLAVPIVVSAIDHIEDHQKQNSLAAVESFCPSEEVLEACFIPARCDQNFCHCEGVAPDNVLVYQSNFLYDFILMQRKDVSRTYLILCLVFLLGFLLQMLYLVYLIFVTGKEGQTLSGIHFKKLRFVGGNNVGSFRLFGRYVIWPRSFDSLSENDQEIILHHELQHIQQNDTLVKLMFNLFWLVWVVNPVFYKIRKELHLVSEYLCDQAAITRGNTTKKEYAQLLLSIAQPQHSLIVSGLGSSHLKLRIQELFRREKKARIKNVRTGWLMLVVIAIAIAVPCYSMMNQQESKVDIYQSLAEMNRFEGKSVFCKQCFVERIQQR